MRLFRIEAPEDVHGGVLVPVAELRDQLRLDTDEQDDLLAAYERAAVAFLDGYGGRLGRCILRQTWALALARAPEAVFLPFPDCRHFRVARRCPRGSSGGGWSRVTGVTITRTEDHALVCDLPASRAGLYLIFEAGWETAEDVPCNLKQAVRLLVAHWFDNRSAVTIGHEAHQVPLAVDDMIAPLRHVIV